MSELFITPNIPAAGNNPIQAPEINSLSKSEAVSFKSIFQDAVNQVKTTENELSTQQYLLSTGQIDDPSQVTIAAAKAQMSVDLLVTLRTKALEAYNSLINIQI